MIDEALLPSRREALPRVGSRLGPFSSTGSHGFLTGGRPPQGLTLGLESSVGSCPSRNAGTVLATMSSHARGANEHASIGAERVRGTLQVRWHTERTSLDTSCPFVVTRFPSSAGLARTRATLPRHRPLRDASRLAHPSADSRRSCVEAFRAPSMVPMLARAGLESRRAAAISGDGCNGGEPAERAAARRSLNASKRRISCFGGCPNEVLGGSHEASE
jgi:hypothetical protein